MAGKSRGVFGLITYTAVMCYFIPKETFQQWKRFGLIEKIIAGGGVTIIFMGIGVLILVFVAYYVTG